jgi:Fic family protein
MRRDYGYSPHYRFHFEGIKPNNRLMTQIWTLPSWPQFHYETAELEPLLVEVAELLGRVKGLHAGLSPKERERIILMEITQEALHSFSIEGIRLDPNEIEASVVASLSARNRAGVSRRSDAVVQIMIEARDPLIELDQKRLFSWHQLLFQGTEQEEVGQWRSFDLNIVKSARADREEILYTAPPPDKLEIDMTNWFDGLERPVVRSTPIHAALMHLWFESIHPFSDGNGRIGRTIIEHIFARSGALPFSLSRQIEADKKAYYAALQAGRAVQDGKICATPFVRWFLETMIKAAERGLDEAKFLIQRNQFFMTHTSLRPRQEAVLRRLFQEGAERIAIGLSAKAYGKIAKTSPATTTRDLNEMVQKGVLNRNEQGGRSTWYSLNLAE